MRVVVTGGSGKAGRAIVRNLLEHGQEVLNVDLVPSPESSSPDSPAPFLRADLTDFGQALGALSGAEVMAPPEAVVHLAAIPSPRTCDGRHGLPHEHGQHARRLLGCSPSRDGTRRLGFARDDARPPVRPRTRLRTRGRGA